MMWVPPGGWATSLLWSVTCRTEDGRAVRLLTVIDEYTRECMAIQAARRIRSDDVMHTLTGLFTSNGVPENIRSVICDYSVKSTFPR